MKEIIVAITGKGRVTIPVEIRRHLGIALDDKIVFVIDEQGTVSLKVLRYPTVATLRGAAGRLQKSLSWRKMQEIAYEDRNNESKEGC